MSYQSLLGALLPPVSYSPDQSMLSAELYAEGNAIEAATTAADRVKNAVTPLYAEAMLPDWERVLLITPSSSDTYQSRLNAVLSKLNETGGLSISYFVNLASNIGYQIAIDEPQQFRAGISRAGDRINADEIIWVWSVYVAGGHVKTYGFRAGESAAGERLTSYSDPIIEAVLNDLKPAHTLVYFSYQES